MKRLISRIVVAGYFLLGLPWAVWCMWDDYYHPERWSDLQHCFPLEAALLAVVLVLFLAVGCHIARNELAEQRARMMRPSMNGVPHG